LFQLTYISDLYFLPIIAVWKRWKAMIEGSWHLMKTLDLSPDFMGVSAFDTIEKNAFNVLISKCGQHIFRIIYKKKSQQLHASVECQLSFHIATYCFNVTRFDLAASIRFTREVEILAEDCKNIREFRLKLDPTCGYEEQLTKLFEVDKKLGRYCAEFGTS